MKILYGTDQYDTPGLIIPDAEWDDLVALCQASTEVVRPRTDKWKCGWICPAILDHGAASRKNTDVASMAEWVGLDLDHTNWSLWTLLRYLPGISCIVYSTTNSTADAPRWRVLVAVSRAMSVDEFAGVWRALNILFDGEVDERTRNCNRLHYLPATWIDGNNEFQVQHGSLLDVDGLLECCPPEEPQYYTVIHETDGVRGPDGTEIVTQAMIDKHLNSGRKGGRFFKLLCAAATRHKANGWALSASELANAAQVVSPVDSNGMKRAMSALREAEKALSYIDTRVDTVSPKDRLMANLKWRYSQPRI